MGSSPSKSSPTQTSSSSQSSSRTNQRAAQSSAGGLTPSGGSSANMAGSSQQVQVASDEFVFETFHHKTGKSYVCMFYGGQRYYLDSWDSQEWKPFPPKWHAEGTLVRDDGGSATGANADEVDVQGGFTLSDNQDDREGVFHHPRRGPLPTYMVEEKRNIMYFYDDGIGMWVKVPAAWEAQADFMLPIVRTIKEAVPSWRDDIDIVAALRQSGYDPDDAIATLVTIGHDDPVISAAAKGSTGNQSANLKKQAEQIRSMEQELKQKDEEIRKLQKLVDDYQSKCQSLELELTRMKESNADMEVETKNTKFQMVGIQREKTKLLREKTMLEDSMRTKAPAADAKSSPAKGGKKASAPTPAPALVAPPAPTGPVITKETELLIKSIHEAAKKVDRDHINLKTYVEKELKMLGDMMNKLNTNYKKMRESENALGGEIEEVRALYRKEMMQRKMLYNQLQELKGNIRVFCRVRPKEPCALKVGEDTVTCKNSQGKWVDFEFDKVYGQNTKQAELFEDTKPIITSAADGYQVCIIAYGQTGSGKTYTMQGPVGDEANMGVNVRAVKELLDVCGKRERQTFRLSANMLEVYNEKVLDVLRDPKDKDPPVINVKIVGKTVNVENAIEVEINTVKDVLDTIKRADSNRHQANTLMNKESSRSHLLLKLNVECTNGVTGAKTLGSLTLVDLAGSERIAKSGVQGQALVEAAAINSSLSALGKVFSALRTKSVHVPYRDSKLTQLLQPSLGGDAKACIFIAVRPNEENMPETLGTLQFGQNARQTSLGTAKATVVPPPKPK